jgi:hypothetical protein
MELGGDNPAVISHLTAVTSHPTSKCDITSHMYGSGGSPGKHLSKEAA